MFTLTPYEIYIFILCAIVFVALTALFTVMIVYILRLTVKLIRNGVEDERIWREYIENKGKKDTFGVVDRILTVISCAILFAVFGCAVYMQVFSDSVTTSIPLYRVVLSGSMSEKDEGNEYLFENNLNDQFDRFDLILTHKLPDEFDLELYDIVVYEVDGTLIVHRIIEIQEPNEVHPNERYFRLQGDNVDYPDKFPVKYSQMKAIYKGERIPFIGSFFAFMQSPAGYLCVLLLLLSIIAIPLMEKKIEKEELKRLRFRRIQEGEIEADEELTAKEKKQLEKEKKRLAKKQKEEDANAQNVGASKSRKNKRKALEDEDAKANKRKSKRRKSKEEESEMEEWPVVTLPVTAMPFNGTAGAVATGKSAESTALALAKTSTDSTASAQSNKENTSKQPAKKPAKHKGEPYNLYEMLGLNPKTNLELYEKEYTAYVYRKKGKGAVNRTPEVSFVLHNNRKIK